MEIFSRKSFEDTSIREIAEKAQVDIALISHHFGSKFELWKAVIDEITYKFSIKFNENILSSYDSKYLKKHIEDLLNYFVEASVDIPTFSLLIAFEMIEEGQRFDYLTNKLINPIRNAVLPILKKGIEEKIFAQQNEEMLFSMIFGSVSFQIANYNGIKRFSRISVNKDKWVKEIKYSLIANFIKG